MIPESTRAAPGSRSGPASGDADVSSGRREPVIWQPKSTSPIYDVLLLDARNQQSLATIRSLGSRGLRVAALDSCRSAPTFASRWCQQAFRAPAYEKRAEAYVNYLEQLLDSFSARVLIPSSDGTI